MREALQKLKMRQQKQKGNEEAAGTASSQAGTAGALGCVDCGSNVIQATHYYVRFKPADVDQLADLEQAGFSLFFEPLDENAAAGYQAPAPGTTEIPWVYTTVPVGTPLPQYIQQERLADLYLATEDAGDERDPDPWAPTPPEPCREWDPSCHCYVRCGTSRNNLATDPSVNGTATSQPDLQAPNRQQEAVAELRKQGISPLDLYNEAMHITGHDDEVVFNPESSFRSGSTGEDIGAITQSTKRYYPSGNVMVQSKDTRGFTNVPLRRVNVLSRRWFKLGHAYTDANGRFYINKGYRQKAKLIVEFKTDQATTRGFNKSADIWDVALPIRHQMGAYSETQMENMNYTFSYQYDSRTKGALSWAAATAFNTLYGMYDYAAANGILTPPQDINIWLAADFTNGGSAPMLRKLATTTATGQFINYILPGGVIFKRLVQRAIPDITIRFDYGLDNTTFSTNDIDEVLSHELGHSIHYRQVGNDYWTSYINYIIASGGYGIKTNNDAGRIAISEAWGYYTGYNFTSEKYRNLSVYYLADYYRRALEDQVPSNDVYDYNRWVVFGMLYDMTDNGENTNYTHVIDNVNSYNMAQVFKGLQPDVVSVRQYQQRILTQNSSKQAPELEQLVTSYFW